MKFDIFIPAQENNEFDITFKISADTWMDALKLGLSKLGEDSSLVKHLMVDVKEDSFHVTETLNHRVFKISEIREEDKVEKDKVVEEDKKEEEDKKVEEDKKEEEDKKVEVKNKKKKVLIENIVKSPTKKIKLGRIKKEIRGIEDILTEIYFNISKVGEEKDVGKAMEILIDFTIKYIACESASVYLVDRNKNEYYFSAIRGPKADILKELNLKLPIGVGFAGFSMKEDLSLAISDVNNDPRFYKNISDKLGYPTYSMLTIPMSHAGMVYGAIQVINKINNNVFDLFDINVLSYIARYSGTYLARKNNQV